MKIVLLLLLVVACDRGTERLPESSPTPEFRSDVSTTTATETETATVAEELTYRMDEVCYSDGEGLDLCVVTIGSAHACFMDRNGHSTYVPCSFADEAISNFGLKPSL